MPVAITPEMAGLIVPGDPDDPIALQFVPSALEQIILPQELFDPINDYDHSPVKALVHRHQNRVLLKPTNICAVYCRFCFRRDMVGPDGDTITQEDVEQALTYIEGHTEINEVILTGGDPLMLSPKKLAALMRRLKAIPHIRWIRFHTRVPVVSPGKINDEMLVALGGTKPVIMAIHANHPREITAEVSTALARLANSSIVLLGQSVLLKGINDKVETLAELFETMMINRVKPYYLHHPDLTAGTSHFRFPLERGMVLMNGVRAQVSGICIPQYTLDIPGGVIKIAITPDTVQEIEGKPGAYLLRDP
ncbi:MAG: lysine 2,3-aminomutase, partial [Alphaproteobacteria bacterium]|nr:lysine 2,3-aminomutase [Alphaproteobacteria bacterium]